MLPKTHQGTRHCMQLAACWDPPPVCQTQARHHGHLLVSPLAHASQVLKWVESAIQASKVHLLSTDHEEGGEHTWKIPFDPSLKEVTISLSGPGPEIEVRDPLGMCTLGLASSLALRLK